MSGTPQQNGFAERAISAVVRPTRSQLHVANLPLALWNEVVEATMYVRNRTPKEGKTKTRFEESTGHRPSLRNLRVIGQYAVIKGANRTNKWATDEIIGRFVNYTSRSNTFRFLLSNEKVIEACDVRFLPLSFSLDKKQKSQTIFSGDLKRESSVIYLDGDVLAHQPEHKIMNSETDSVNAPDSIESINDRFITNKVEV